MCMRIVEAGHHKLSIQFDYLCVRTPELENLCVFTDGLYAITTNRDRLCALDGVEGRLIDDPRVDVAVDKDCVGARRCRFLGSDCARKKEQQHDDPYVHSPTPASTSKVRRILFSPSSLPEQSNHSCSV